ncbi:hypothetical protein BJ165DRAFT_1514521 [Panaeolus papilionaceus]|nr:hypothetical protein BJ165DRAFT_1514521 [Panaeolus papilionaceus]
MNVPPNPSTPTRPGNHILLTPFTPRTPMRPRARPQGEPQAADNMQIQDVNLPTGTNLIIRGIGANKKNSNPVEILTNIVSQIRITDPSLIPIIIKPFSLRNANDWTTTCYVHIDPSILSRTCADSEPRTDLLEQWKVKLASHNSTWDVAWTPAKNGQDKRMWVRFPDLNDPINQEEARMKVLEWAAAQKYTVCSSYHHKGGITLTMAFPKDVDQIISKDRVNISGLVAKDRLQRVSAGRQIEILQPFELIVLGPLSEYDGLDDLITQWLEDEFTDSGESTLAGTRNPPGEHDTFVFNMTTWAATANVLAPNHQQSFREAFNKYQILPPQLLHTANTTSTFRIRGSIRDDFSKGAETMNKNLLTMSRRLDDFEQQNKQQHLATQLQISSVSASLNEVARSVHSLEDRVTKTQYAILAQSRELGLNRNLTDNSTNILNLKMQILLERDTDKKNELQNLLCAMEAQNIILGAAIKDSSDDFAAIINQGPLTCITALPSIPAQHQQQTNPLASSSNVSMHADATPPQEQMSINKELTGSAGKRKRVEEGGTDSPEPALINLANDAAMSL